MGTIASQITSLTIVYSVYLDADQRKHQSSASLAFVQGIHRGPVNSPHKWLVARKMFPFHDVIICHFKGCSTSSANFCDVFGILFHHDKGKHFLGEHRRQFEVLKLQPNNQHF